MKKQNAIFILLFLLMNLERKLLLFFPTWIVLPVEMMMLLLFFLRGNYLAAFYVD